MKNLLELKKYIANKHNGDGFSVDESLGEVVVTLGLDKLLSFIKFLRDDASCLFSMLMDICVVDYLDRDKRFEVIYNLLSIQHNLRIRIKLNIRHDDFVPSVTSLFSSAGWYEREAWDLYGVYFSNNTDLRRILTDYGFSGHPMRKDFPLTGYNEVRYDLEKRKVVYESVSLPQEFRNFNFTSPWEGTNYILPGDEKVYK